MLSEDARCDVLTRAAIGKTVAVGGRQLPPMLDAQLQINSVNQAGPGARLEAAAFAAQCPTHLRRLPRSMDDQKLLLDFGTGWGRIARCFLRDFRDDDMIGVDVDAAPSAVCRAGVPGSMFYLCQPMPPLLHRDSPIDLAWFAKPFGMAAVTTRGRWFLDYAAGITTTDPYWQVLSRVFPDFAPAKACYCRGDFVYSNAHGVHGPGARAGGLYGEMSIPQVFARTVLGQSLPLAKFYQGDNHPILFFKKCVE